MRGAWARPGRGVMAVARGWAVDGAVSGLVYPWVYRGGLLIKYAVCVLAPHGERKTRNRRQHTGPRTVRHPPHDGNCEY